MATRAEPSLDDHIWGAVFAVVRGIVRIGWWLVRRPVLLAAALLLIGLSVWDGWRSSVFGAAALVVGLLVFRLTWPAGFDRWVSGPLRRARARSGYRRKWPAVAEACGLARWTRDGRLALPRLREVEVVDVAHRLQVQMIVGQSLADWERQTAELASSFGARSARVYSSVPGSVCVELMFGDSLAQPVMPFPVPAAPDLTAVPVGIREDGQVWFLRLLGAHLFIAGETGAGKGSVIWSLLLGVAAAIRDGLVSVWAVDPKGGMELGFGVRMFSRFAAGAVEERIELLEAAVRVMDERCARLAGVTRQHTPTRTEPLILVIIDEVSSLTAYEGDTKLRARATAAISALLARGRAAAVVVVAAAQDSRKEVMPFRSLMSMRLALRLKTPIEVDMVLGDGMHAMGAAADRIPAWTPGVGYVVVEGVREPMRVRATWVDDKLIQRIAAEYPAFHQEGTADGRPTGSGS